jgi:tRNA-specific 2-thiouridylase
MPERVPTPPRSDALKVAVGLSGGVDSAVAALLLKELGHEVLGVTMKLWAGGPAPSAGKSACFGPDEAEDIEAARRVCARLEIPFSVFDCSAGYESLVLSDFRGEYLSGRTPNPCIRCNQLVKFGLLPEAARASGLRFDRFATGHYARVEHDAGRGRYLLKRAVDAGKDQSYFLYRLSQRQLAGILFPLGVLTKDRVRRMAREARLPIHDRKESQDFYNGDLNDILRREAEEGEIVDGRGRVLGTHRGVWNYTIGQRKGLGIASSVPLYVVAIDAAHNRLVVGTEEETYRRSCLVADCNWIAIDSLTAAVPVWVKIRSTSRPAKASISPADDQKVRVIFAEPLAAVTPGQAAVFYQGDVVLGGGTIEAAD